jgi:uncharacterized protein (TIGR03118 family)
MSYSKNLRFRITVAALIVLFAGQAAFAAEPGNMYARRDLVSDGGVPAEHIDPDLINGWGLAASATSPWWVNAADAGKSLLYNGEGVKVPLVVTVQGEPTGIVFNGGPNFVIPGVAPARFIFASEDGTISAWSGALVPNTAAVVVVDNSPFGAIYKGLAIDSTTGGTRIYAADFFNSRVDVFDGSFAPLSVPGAFLDPKLPEGYSPFNVQTLNGSVYVAFALRNEEGDEEVTGDGLGVVDQFDFNGQLIARVATGGALNAPWGMALAPAGFGRFSGKLLVGNFGNGRINVFDPVTFEPKGHLKGTSGKAIQIDGLWGIAFGNGGNAGPTTTLFFAAGPDDEEHGLFGRLDAVPNPGLRTPVAAD